MRLYDISAQRRPVISIDFRETPIKAVAEDLDGWTVYVGNGSGDLASFDMRTGMSHGSMFMCSLITCLFLTSDLVCQDNFILVCSYLMLNSEIKF